MSYFKKNWATFYSKPSGHTVKVANVPDAEPVTVLLPDKNVLYDHENGAGHGTDDDGSPRCVQVTSGAQRNCA